MFDEERQIRKGRRNNRRHSSISNNIPIFEKYIPFFLVTSRWRSNVFSKIVLEHDHWKRYKIPLKERKGGKKKEIEGAEDKNGIIRPAIQRSLVSTWMMPPPPHSFPRFRHRDHVPSMSIKNVNRWLNEGGERGWEEGAVKKWKMYSRLSASPFSWLDSLSIGSLNCGNSVICSDSPKSIRGGRGGRGGEVDTRGDSCNLHNEPAK